MKDIKIVFKDRIPYFINVATGDEIPRQDALKTIRKQQGWTAKDLAEKLLVDQRTVNGWESRGKIERIPPGTAMKLLEFVLISEKLLKMAKLFESIADTPIAHELESLQKSLDG